MTGSRPTANPIFLREDDLRQGMELLYLAYRDFARDADDILAQHSFTRVHHRVIHFIQRHPGISASDLRSILGVTKQSLSRALGDLVRDGLVVESKGESDRRRKLLDLTPRGADLERKLSEAQRERIARAYGAAGAEAVQGYRRVLEGLIKDETRARIPGRRGGPGR